MTRFPALFISHGSPMLAIDGQPAHHFLRGYARQLPRPAAILIVSAHWLTRLPVVATSPHPAMIYDFGGFDPRLDAITYPAPGASVLARDAQALLNAAGLATTTDPQRGYDHGVWVPLSLLYPEADIPIAQLALQPLQPPAYHLAIGRALAPLRERNVLIIGSGAMTHNLREFGRHRNEQGVATPAWVSSFAEWMHARLEAADTAALADYRRQAPNAERNHPEDEHLLPLFVPLGATQLDEPIRRVHASVDAGVLAMDCYRFGA